MDVEKVEVVPADRELIGDIAEWMQSIAQIDGNDVAAIRKGVWDGDTEDLGSLLQIAARHRLAALEASGVRELVVALERLERNFDLLLAGKPVRDVAETQAEVRRARTLVSQYRGDQA